MIRPKDVIERAGSVWANPNIVDEKTDTEVYVEVLADSIEVTFNVTQSWKDVWTDLLAFSKSGIHYGFYKAVESVELKIMATILKNPNKKVIVFGQSLGGALAQVFSYILYDKYKILVDGCYATGAPKPFLNEAMAFHVEHCIGSKIKRFIAYGDPVPNLPFWGHGVGSVEFLGENKWYYWLGLGWKNHFPGNYIKY